MNISYKAIYRHLQTKHETLLVISIIDNFCAQLKLFCETVISSEYFQVV